MSTERKWTASQLSAIETHGKTLLVSASAGSGKTAALTERIIRSLINTAVGTESCEYHADISRMLIVTFTKAAAAELKERISSALEKAIIKFPDNEYLRRQLIILPGAHISTIDSFYMDSVKTNFNILGIPSNFRIAEQSELGVTYSDVMDDIVEEYFNNSTGIDFALLADNFTDYGNDAALSGILLKIYSELTQYPEGIDLLLTYAAEYENAGDNFFGCNSGRMIKEKIIPILNDFIKICDIADNQLQCDEVLYKAYSPAFSSDRAMYEALFDAIKEDNYAKARELLLNFSFGRFGRTTKASAIDIKEKFRGLRDSMKKRIKEIAVMLSSKPEDINFYLSSTANVCRLLHSVLSDYENRVKEEKMSRSIFDFSDITALMHRLVIDDAGNPTEAARNISARFDEIYIDEYQDTNYIQDEIFRAISTPTNRFMVGDIKQSIYSFRGARPDIFAAYRQDFPILGSDSAKSSENASVFMSENFRCDENIIRFINEVCAPIFRYYGNALSYSDQDDLIFAKQKPYENYVSPKVKLVLIDSSARKETEDDEKASNDSDVDTGTSSSENEAQDTTGDFEYRYIANEIIGLLKNGKKEDGTKIKPDDIAILVRTHSQIERLTAILEEYSLKSVSPASEDIFATPEVLLLTSLLSVIDNPTNDIPLASLLRSPVFDFSLDELIIIRNSGEARESLYENIVSFVSKNQIDENHVLRKKCNEFLEWLEKYRYISCSLTVDRLLRLILRDERCLFAGNSESVSEFYNYARQYESGSFKGLYNFIKYVDSIKTMSVNGNDEFAPDENAVTIMSIHKSKGLEFPVCFVAGMSKSFNFRDMTQDYAFEHSTGFAVNISDSTGFARYQTPLRFGINIAKKRLMMQEEMRVLYVAMTRARERLYLTATVKDPRNIVDYYDGIADITDADSSFYVKNYLQWILGALAGSLNAKGESLNSVICTPSAEDPFELLIFDHRECVSDSLDNVPISAKAAEKDDENCESPCSDKKTKVSDKLTELFKKRFSFNYKYDYMTYFPTKLSISKLTPEILDDVDRCQSPLEYGKESKLTLITETPLTLENKDIPTPTEKGIATHLIFQFCDFNNIRKNGFEKELDRLIGSNYIPMSTVRIAYHSELKLFESSELFSEIYRASKVYREQRFNLRFKASDFTADPVLKQQLDSTNESLLVQGVIDIFFENADGKLILCDYKTDRIPKEMLKDDCVDEKIRELMSERHGKQLEYYKAAIKEMCGKYPDLTLVYCTQTGKTYEI